MLFLSHDESTTKGIWYGKSLHSQYFIPPMAKPQHKQRLVSDRSTCLMMTTCTRKGRRTIRERATLHGVRQESVQGS